MGFLRLATNLLMNPRRSIWLALMYCLVPLLLPNATFAGGEIVNLSSRAYVSGNGNNIAIGGLIVQGAGSATLLFRGLGPSLPFGSDNLSNPVLQLRNSSGTTVYYNDNWQDTQASQISATGIPPTNSLESAMYVTVAPGNYTVTLQGIGGVSGIGSLEAYDLSARPYAAPIVNLSTRAYVGTGNHATILGLNIQGGNRTLLFRGLGPSLPFGSADLSNPYLQVFNSSGGLVYGNNDWHDTQASQILATGAAPSNNLESAIVLTLPQGSYTALLNGANSATGIGSVEVYDITKTQVWVDNYGAGSYASNNTPIELRRTGVLYPSHGGIITVHYTYHAVGYCGIACYPPPYPNPVDADVYPELLDQNGVVLQGGRAFATGNTADVSGTVTFASNGAPFIIRMMATSRASTPQPDYVTMTYYDVYAP
jgi:hypothetical protein